MIFKTKLMRKLCAMAIVLPVFALCVACGEDPTSNNESTGDDDPTEEPGKPSGGEDDKYEDIKVVDGKVRFYLKEQENSTRTVTDLTARDWAKSSVIVNGKNYEISMSEGDNPRPYIEVAESGSYNATLITPESGKWYGSSTYADIKLPFSQFSHTSAATIKSFPMYASYTKENGNKLIFKDGFAMVLLKLKGSAKITSVKVENLADKEIAGTGSLMPSKGSFTIKKGVNYAVLNCTNKGDFTTLTSSKATYLRVMIAPGNYTEGLKVSICDSQHLAMFHTSPAVNLAAGDLYVIETDYAPESDLAFYEGFDNLVWGGDIMKGDEGFGYAPTAEKVNENSSAELTGYEDALTEVSYDNPGTGYIQSNTWADVSGKMVSESHRMSESYVKSRNLDFMRCMFRTQEYPGYIAVGAASTARGIFTSPSALGMKGIGRMKATIRFALQAGFTGNLSAQVNDGGIIMEAKLNGEALTLDRTILVQAGAVSLKNGSVTIPSSAAAVKEWNTLELIIDGATDGTKFYLADEFSTAGVHGVYVDSIEARQVEEWKKEDGTLRVLLWNILYGMWCDQHNNYDNFVKWVKKWDPDVCIWCESESLAPDNSASGSLAEKDKFLPDGWSTLCTRYGHAYAVVGGNRDGFPQTITSKYPIKTVKKITDSNVKGKPITHGAGHFTIEVNGKKINFVTLHMWPQAYAYGVSGTANQEADAAKNGGAYYREFEMQYIVDNTVNLPANAGEELWILGGDTNARSRLDSWFYSYAEDHPIYLTHDVVRKQTNLKDVIGDYYANHSFMSSTYGSARIDILYASPKMFERIKSSITLADDWCAPRLNGNARGWYAPSDHRPIMVDFDIK